VTDAVGGSVRGREASVVPETGAILMTATRIRRIAAVALAAAGLTAIAAPGASADSLLVRTTSSVPAPYDASALLPSGRDVLEGKGPVMINVRHRIQCLRGTVRRPGYGPMCQWSSGMFGTTATVSPRQGQGDVYAAGINGYPIGTTFHAGTLREGQSTFDDWAVVVRNDTLAEGNERFTMSVSATAAGSLQRTFTIIDDEA
jgi:hypothetical protein